MVMLKALGSGVRKLAAVGSISLLVGLTGCPFFQCEGKTDCGTNSTSTGTGDYVYVSNSTTGTEYINGYTVGNGTLTAITGSPFSLGYVPVAMQVSPDNLFLYVAGQGSAGLYVYPISSTGALSTPTELLSGIDIDAMTVSPDGNFLMLLSDTSVGEILNEYTRNTTTGTLGAGVTQASLPTGTACVALGSTNLTVNQLCSIQVAPTEDLVTVAAGTAGVAFYSYSSGIGIAAAPTSVILPPTGYGDFSAAFDGSENAYVASTLQLLVYDGLTSATPTQVSSTAIASGTDARAVTLSTSYNYLFTANLGTNQISAYSVGSGGLTAFGTPSVLGPTGVAALGVDRSGTYLLAAGYSATSGLEMFTIGSGTLSSTPVASEGTGASTSVPVVIAMTHS
jgi:6-phosphogluconolactonase